MAHTSLNDGEFDVQEILPADIATRGTASIAIKQHDDGAGKLIITISRDGALAYFFVDNITAIRIYNVIIGDTYDGIPVDMNRAMWDDALRTLASM